jgi:hypothetical protein
MKKPVAIPIVMVLVTASLVMAQPAHEKPAQKGRTFVHPGLLHSRAELESVSGHDAKLLIGMTGVKFCNAAELVRHTDAGWSVADQKQFKVMLRQVFYPVIEDFYPTANGNWDASMIQTMLAMGLGFLGCACEMAWMQGVNLYGAADNRLAKGFEYTAKYNLGEDVPYEPYKSVEGRYHYKKLSSISRGCFVPIYERAVHHYQGRAGLDMVYSQQVAVRERPEGLSGSHVPWGTLMFYGLSKDNNMNEGENHE